MNKEQIDEIVLRVMSDIRSKVDGDDEQIKAFDPALLAELAKVSEPEAYMYHIKGNGKLTELAAIEYQEQFGETIIHKRALYSIPPQQPDLVADIEQLRQQLSAAQQDLGLCKLTLEQKVEQLGHCESALAAAQADNEQLVKALEEIKLRSISLADAQVVALEAIAAHKARKEKA